MKETRQTGRMFTRHKGYWISMEERTPGRLRIRIGKKGSGRILKTLWANQGEEGLSLATMEISKMLTTTVTI